MKKLSPSCNSSPESPISEAELAQHAAQHLAPYKRPSQILLVSLNAPDADRKSYQGRTRQDGTIRFYPLTTPSRQALQWYFNQRRSFCFESRL